jgi:ADP-ribose pyrophosphatase YjhB (NUDIX family)
MTSKIDVTVAAMVETDGRFLFVEEQASGRIVFNQPAGHLEPGESLTDAVVRETFEETGYGFQPEALLGLYLWQCDEANTTFLRVAFTGSATPPVSTPNLDSGIIAAHWLSRAQVVARESRLRSPLVMRCLDDYQADIRHPLSVISELPPEELERLAGSSV